MIDENQTSARFTRRRLLHGGAAMAAGAGLAAYLPASVRKAMAENAPTEPFDVSQIKHVVVLMQENRSFDHYFGTLPGVAGFSDRTAVTLPDGRSVFYQPDPANPDGYLLPWHLDATNTSAQAAPSLSHAWQTQHEAWNRGRMDSWVSAHSAVDGSKIGPFTMGYYTEADIPFHHALANAFTVCDRYFCSTMSSTDPNRIIAQSGTIDPNGLAGGPVIDQALPAKATWGWKCMPELLQENGVSWKCYQALSSATGAQPTGQGTGITGINSVGYNMTPYFAGVGGSDPTVPYGAYQNALYGSTLFGSPNGVGLAGQDASLTNPYTGAPFDYTENFEQDCYNGTLPEVSWLFTEHTYTEHPTALPAAGATFIASKIAAIAANPDLWKSTVFILHYDENDGYFDHVPPITPPAGTADEFVTLTSPGGTPGLGYPVGSGFRVPCVIVSPWSVGGYVCSEPFDHTSVLQFIEAAFLGGQPINPNISAWRRQTFGNLTSALQGGTGVATPPSDPNLTYASTQQQLSTQTANASLPLPVIPRANQPVPAQEPGSRPTIG